MPYKCIEARRACKRRYMRRLRQRYRAAGGCLECGVPVAGFAMCFPHRVRSANRRRAHGYGRIGVHRDAGL